jgi:spermidine synthase
MNIFIIFTTSAISIIYEFLFANLMSQLTGHHVLWMTFSSGIYLLGMGLGTYLEGKNQQKLYYKRLFHIEIYLSIIGMLCIPTVYWIHTAVNIVEISIGSISLNFILFGFICEIICFVIGILSGMEFPIVIKQNNGKNNISLLIGFNYFGALLGSLIYALILKPSLPFLEIALIVSSLNIILAAFIAIKSHNSKIMWKAFVPIPLTCLLLFNAADIRQIFLKMRYYYKEIKSIDPQSEITKNIKKVLKKENVKSIITPYQKIDITNSYYQSIGRKILRFYIDGKYQIDSTIEQYYHEAMAHVPMILTKKIPKKILIIGGGDGMLIEEILKYEDQIDSITHIDLDKSFVEYIKYDDAFYYHHYGSLNHQKVKSHFTDAFPFLRKNKILFDAIYMDVTDPFSYNTQRLFSHEFFKYINSSLKPDGFFVFNSLTFFDQDKGILYSKENRKAFNSILWSTLKKAKFKNIYPYRVKDINDLVISSFIMTTNQNAIKINPEFKIPNLFTKNLEVFIDEDIAKMSIGDFKYKESDNSVNSIFVPKILSFMIYAEIFP